MDGNMIMEFWHNWFFWALLTPAIWAIVTILDVCLVGSGIYDRAIDGAVISAGFSIFPLLLILPLVEVAQFNAAATVSASIAGGCFFFHTLFFLKALFALNDAAGADSIDTLSVVLVPILAFLFLDEILTPHHYLAIALTAVGTGVLAVGYFIKTSVLILVFSLLSVLFVSMASVAQAHALSRTNYETALAIFSITVVLFALVPFMVDTSSRTRVTLACRKFGALFIATECLQLSAMLSSHRAIQVAPSVSLVRVAESSSPIFLLIFSALTINLFRHFSYRPGLKDLQVALALQLSNLSFKLVALTFISAGVWLICIPPD